MPPLGIYDPDLEESGHWWWFDREADFQGITLNTLEQQEIALDQ